MRAWLILVGTFITPTAITMFLLFNYSMGFGPPWRPLVSPLCPETPVQRRLRWLALVATILAIITAYLAVIAGTLAGRHLVWK